MLRFVKNGGQVVLRLSILGLWFVSFVPQAGAAEVERTNVTIVVKDSETGDPVSQARLTLQFREPGSKLKLKRAKLISFSAKTNAKGHYKFINIPKGTIRLMVIADRHQTFGKEIELEQDNQVIEVKLKPPQPLL